MSNRLIAIVCAVLIGAFFPINVSARPVPYPKVDYEDLPVNIRANYMNYDGNGNYLDAKGSVEIIQGDRTLKAEYMRINLVTKDTEARGNVELYEGEDILYCDSFNINLDTQLGEVKSARIFIKEQNFHIQGKEVKRFGPDKYKIRKGTVTTCDGKNPLWKINAEEIDVTIEGYARVRNSTLRIKGFPVLYLPYAIFPVKTKRQSGLLFPGFRHSKSAGTEINNTFFWAISENTDATFWLDAATKKGLGTGVEYRFKLKEKTWGKFYGYFTKEENRYFDHEYRRQRDREQERGYLNFEGEHYFSKDFYAKAHGSYVSDREFYGDYRSEVKRSKGNISKSSIKTREKDESSVFFNKNWDFYNLLANFNLYKNLMNRDPHTLQRLPQLVFSGVKSSFMGTPLFYQFYSAYDFFWREEGQKGQRVDIFPKISWPVNYGGWLKFNSEIGLRGISNFNLKHYRGVDEEGVFPSIRAELSTTFMRIFTINRNWIKKLKHTVEPGLLYEYVPTNEQTDFPSFDTLEGFYRRHSIGYYVKNRFTGLIVDQRGELEEREIGYFMIGQSFNIREPDGGMYLAGDAEEEFSDIFCEIRLGISTDLYFKAKAFYDPYDNNMRYYNALVNWSNNRREFLEFEYRYARDRYEILDLEGRIRLTGFLYAFFDLRYDYLEYEDLDAEIGIDYVAQCWGSRFSIESSGATAGRVSDTSFNFMFYLKGLGGKL